MNINIPIWISNRHIHLSQKDANILFWTWYKFEILKELKQKWEYAYKEIVSIVGTKWTIEKVRILWPFRKETQLELLTQDLYKLWIQAPIRISWDLENSWKWAKIIWPKWIIDMKNWIIIAQRHIHISDKQAKKYNLKQWEIIKIKTEWIRSVIFENVIVRVKNSYDFEFHIDREEWNSAWLKQWDLWTIIK